MSDPVRNYDHKTIQFRRGTTAEWQKFGSTCIPAEAEICVEFFQNPTGSRNGSVGIKVGNGVSTFNQLPHIVSDEESDPVFTNHPAYQITQDLIDSWNDDAEGISDAPNSKAYSRQKGVWVEAPTLNQVKDLEAKVDAIDPDGGGSVGWDEIEGKPSTFPPSAHNHDGDYLKTETDPTVPAHVKAITQTDIDGWNAGGSGGASTWDQLTGKPTEFPPESHTHEQSEVDGLEIRLDAIEDSITSGGGFVDAPNDGKLYGRQSESWAEVPDGGVSDWADIENKPTEFPPADHDQPWSTITDTPDDYPPEDHTHEIDDIDGLQDALDNAGTSYAVAIADTPPENGKSGDTWFDSTEGEGALYIHDGDVWFSSNTFGQGSSGGSGGSIEAIASGALATGETVIVNADGGVSSAQGVARPEAVGPPTALSKLEVPRLTYIPSSNEFVICHEGGARVVSIDGDSVNLFANTSGGTIGNPMLLQIDAAYCSGSDRLVMVYRDKENSNFGGAVLCEINNSVITFGTPFMFSSDQVNNPSITYDSVADRFVIVHRGPDNGCAVVGKITPDKKNITFGSEVEFNPTYASDPRCCFDPTSEKTVVAFIDNSNNYAATAVVGTISGDSIQFGPTTLMADSTSPRLMFITPASDEGKLVFIYGDGGAGNAGIALVGTVNGDAISFGAKNVFDSEYVNIGGVTFDSDNQILTVFYTNVTQDSAGITVTGTLSGDELSLSQPAPLNVGKVRDPLMAYDDNAKKNVIHYNLFDAGGGSEVSTFVPSATVTNLTDTNYIGTSSADYADGETATIQTVGSVSEDQSGLTAGLAYYVQPDGSLGASGSVFAGTAISPTKLIVKG